MKKISIVITLFAIIWFSCTNASFTPSGFDCSEEVSYNTNMKGLIDTYCAYSGCHLGAVGWGDYTSYAGMEPFFTGIIEERVISLSEDPDIGMPPDYAEDGPIDLLPEDFMLINCWIQQGFPEN